MAAGLIFDFHLGNKKFTAVINITFYFDAGAYVKICGPPWLSTFVRASALKVLPPITQVGFCAEGIFSIFP